MPLQRRHSKKALSPDFYLWPNIYICICTSYTVRYVCMLSLQYIWISSGLSMCLVPTPGLASEYPSCSMFVCAYTHTQHSNTHQPPVQNGETLPLAQTNPRTITLETSANHRPAGKTPLPPLFFIRMHDKNMIKMMSATKSTTTTAHRNSCKLRWSCASPFRSVASRRIQLPLILHPTISFFLPTKRRQRAFFGKDAFTTAKCTVAGVMPSSQHLSTYAGAESIQMI